jgi:hypothetical protein
VSEPFADLTFERATGELTGRGHAVSLRPYTVPAFAALWKAKGDVVPLSARYGRYRASGMAVKLRESIARFDLTVEGVRSYGGHRLVDLRARKEEATS